MIRANDRSNGVATATIICDDCNRSDVVACDYERRGQDWHPNEGQAIKKALGHGWAFVKGKLRCAKCEASRKAKSPAEKEPITMTASTTAPREPTAKQERLIIMELENAYDDQAKRYRGQATDKTVADDLGDGIMSGWVTRIREKLFGPSGENEEIAAIKAEISALRAECTIKVDALSKRLDAVCAAVGPKART